MSTSEQTQVRTYGNLKPPGSPGLWGLGSVGTAALIAGLVVTIVVSMVLGILAALGTLCIVSAAMAAVVVKDRHGRTMAARTGTRVAHWHAVARGTNRYRSGPGHHPLGVHGLPGVGASLRLSEHDTSAGRIGLLYAPSPRTYTVIVSADPDGSALVDPATVDQRVAQWGHLLAQWADEPGLVGVSVTVETRPDTGHRLHEAVNSMVDPRAPKFAQELMSELAILYPAGSHRITAHVALTFAAAGPSSGRRRDAAEVAADLSSRLPGLLEGLAGTGAGAVRALSAEDLCALVAGAYDPGAGAALERDPAAGLLWTDVGPVAAVSDWDTYRHDSGVSVTWEMSAAPAGAVQAQVLRPLLAPHPATPVKRVTLHYRPVPSGVAAALVEADKRAAHWAVTATKQPSAADLARLRAAEATEAEQAVGAGLVGVSLMVTATVNDRDAVAAAVAAVEQMAANARLRLRRSTGAQDSAFLCALPLGLDPARLLGAIPSALKGRL